MQLSAVLLARVLAYIETADLGQGRVFFPEITPHIVDRYKFQKFPQTLEQFDEAKGVEFREGKIGGIVLLKLGIWESLLTLETSTNTADSKRILEEMLQWGADKLGLNYRPGMIQRFGYISDLTFYTDAPILDMTPAITQFSEKLSGILTDVWQDPLVYEPMNFQIGHDPLTRKNNIAPFSITRRAQSRFSENKYFSEAPLPTDVHIQMINELEAIVLKAHAKDRS